MTVTIFLILVPSLLTQIITVNFQLSRRITADSLISDVESYESGISFLYLDYAAIFYRFPGRHCILLFLFGPSNIQKNRNN